MRVHLVDGTYELFRAYYGVPGARSPGGIEVGAVRGLLRSLRSLLRETEVTHLGIAFDHVVESFRNDLFDGYKTGQGIEPDLFAQFPLAERAARALGLVVWPMVEFEADDALATAAARWWNAPGVEQIVICSPDKDLGQCVRGDRVVLRDRRRRITLGSDEVREKFGVEPASIPDYLALVGDAADGVPGVPRWGAKAASTLLARYRTIKAIPRDLATWDVEVRGAAGLLRSLTEHESEAALYKTLTTLRVDVPLPETLEDLHWRKPMSRELDRLCREIGDPGFLRSPVRPAP